ncbi:hypothetical protein PIROE2DRAFT_16599 [Piromyces sp. E2]|nr:hypothetical protein PIROE2DRAFT_16599 [Piromyces sp. E2]|eukprot:OUM58206.1 hypothetical protein PIROE2DRAFT_16599 [Piromyces sp. E2]
MKKQQKQQQQQQQQQQQSIVITNDRTKHSRYLMVYAILGYTLCYIADLLFECLPNGEVTRETFFDFKLFEQITRGATTNRFAISGVLGMATMILTTLGLVGMSEYVHMYSKIASEIMLVAGVSAVVLGVGYHLFCTLSPWIFLALNSTENAYNIKDKLYNDHILIFQIEPLSIGKTPLPRWAAILNIGMIYSVLEYFKIHGSSNLAGSIMSTENQEGKKKGISKNKKGKSE